MNCGNLHGLYSPVARYSEKSPTSILPQIVVGACNSIVVGRSVSIAAELSFFKAAEEVCSASLNSAEPFESGIIIP